MSGPDDFPQMTGNNTLCDALQLGNFTQPGKMRRYARSMAIAVFKSLVLCNISGQHSFPPTAALVNP